MTTTAPAETVAYFGGPGDRTWALTRDPGSRALTAPERADLLGRLLAGLAVGQMITLPAGWHCRPVADR